jgi:O-acetylserine/cysteine efflux transporter
MLPKFDQQISFKIETKYHYTIACYTMHEEYNRGFLMSRRDWILTLLVVLVWGANFTVIKIGLGSMPPMLLAAIRYFFVAFPAIFIVKRPNINWRYFLGYGLTIGVGQFSCLNYAIHIGMPAGLASIVLQSSSFITILMATLIFKEVMKARQIAGLIISLSGLILIGITTGRFGNQAIPTASLFLIVLSAFFWSVSTMIVKSALNQANANGVHLDTFGIVVWSAIVSPLPLIGFSLMMDRPQVLLDTLLHLNATAIISILFLAWISTLFGAGVWNYLLSRYETGRVAPLSLLVPAAGLLTARIFLAEQLNGLQWAGSLVIIIGLVFFNFGFVPLQWVGRLFRHVKPDRE